MCKRIYELNKHHTIMPKILIKFNSSSALISLFHSPRYVLDGCY